MTVNDGQIRWERFPQAGRSADAKQWLEIQRMLGLAPNTVEAYGRGVEDFLGWCKRTKVKAVAASRADLAAYVGDLRNRPGPRGKGVVTL